MGTARFHWHQGTRHFVLALGAAFKACVAMVYTPLQGLVIAGLEVQAIHALQRTPVAPIGHARLGAIRIRAAQPDQTAGDRLARALGYKQEPVFRHITLHSGKESAAEVGRIAMFQVGTLVAAIEKIPVGIADVEPLGPAKLHACVKHFAPFLTDFFALVLRQAGQKGVEVGESGPGIGPVELHCVA